MKRRQWLIGILMVLVSASSSFAQGLPSGTLTGVVTHDGQGLPGVTVTVSSPALQGTRTEVSRESGEYIFPFLPPGDYSVTFVLSGFQQQTLTTKVAAAQTQRVNASLSMASVTETITVTASQQTVSGDQQAAMTFQQQELVEKLPIARDMDSVVALAPGVHVTGPRSSGQNQITISGAHSYENLFLLNGVVINENLRGQSLPLYIEDAIQETTIATAGISAEYGRFAGGVVNAITKSGGNEFSGSLRTNMTNDSWVSETPLTVSRADKVNRSYEATLGGRILRDRLWFFAAGRSVESETQNQTSFTNIPFTTASTQDRYEGKLTLSATPRHNFVGSFIGIDQATSGTYFTSAPILDTRSLVNRQDPQELKALHYNGVITNNFFVEAQYSARDFIIGRGQGAMSSDRVEGTLLIDQSRGARFWSPTFCGVCGPAETRDNRNLLGKATYFLTTSGGSSHEISAGFDRFDDLRQADNYQSGSNFRIFLDSAIIRNGEIFPVLRPYPNTDFYYQPIFETSLGNRFRTDSLYLNDRWRPTDRLQVNLGLRYDKNDGVDQAGNQTADDSAFSPRLGFTYDVFGNGGLLVNGSYGRYVTAIANSIGDAASAAGNATTFAYRYEGPAINTDPNNLVPTAVALQQFWAWFDSVGGTNNTDLIYGVGGGNSTAILESLSSPYADEFTVGAARRIGNRGIVRMDYVHREYGDFYVNRIDRTTGTAVLPGNIVVDRTLVENDDSALERKYDAIQLQSQFRFFDRLTAGGNYTWSQAIGNFIGETAANGPVRTSVFAYPEYSEVSWFYPRGFLPNDQRHNAKAWLLYDVLSTGNHALNVSLLQTYQSGTPYGAAGTLNIAGYTPDQGYRRPPTTASYYFTGRDAFRTDDVTRTDLALNYALRLRLLGAAAEIFVQPEVLNVFNEQAVVNPNATVFTSTTGGRGLQRFNPWLGGASVECPQGTAAAQCTAMGAHWQKGPNFGRPSSPTDYQTPRTYRVSVGMRF